MYNLKQKQKIILGIIIAIIIGCICYYVYAREEESTTENLENNLEIQEETTKEEYSDETILVHVSGAVKKEGVIELKINSRISDAIEKAEGIREDACIEDINLAYKLEDGMKIHIPTKQEKEEKKEEEYVTTLSGIHTNQEETEKKDTKVNINTATQTQLETLPGIGPSTAMKILDYRKEKGKFTKIEEIKEVGGIGEAKFDKIKDLITT